MEPSAVRKAMTLPPVQKKSQWSKPPANSMVKQSPAERRSPLTWQQKQKPVRVRNVAAPMEPSVAALSLAAVQLFQQGLPKESSVAHPETPPARQQMSLALVK